MIIINATIFTSEQPEIIQNGFIEISDSKIIRIGTMDTLATIPKGKDVYDISGCYVLPGLIDVHTHLGIIGDSLGFEGDDVNEITDPSTPHLRALDAVNPMDICFRDAYSAGVTAVVTGPGSSNAISGQMLAMKTYGNCIDDMILKAPVAIKFALGENPKSEYHFKNLAPETRMATAAIIREALKKAKHYMEALDAAQQDEELDEPEFDFKCEALLPLLKREIPAHFHAHRADDIFTAVRIAKEFSIKYSLVHCTEGHLVAKELNAKKENGETISAFVGPILCDRGKPELKNLETMNAKVLAENEISVSIITDHSEVPIQYLMLSAMIAVKDGLPKSEAIRAITINPAKAIGLDHKIGSIKVGKDADLVIYDGDPFDFYSKVKQVIIDGQEVYLAKGGEAKCE